MSYKRGRRTGAPRKTVDSGQRGEREGEAVEEDEPDEESCFLAPNRRVADETEGSGRTRWTRDIVTNTTPEGSTNEPPPQISAGWNGCRSGRGLRHGQCSLPKGDR